MFFEEKNWPSVLVGHPSRLKLLFNLWIPSNIIFLGQCIPAIFLHRIPVTFNGCKIVNIYIYIITCCGDRFKRGTSTAIGWGRGDLSGNNNNNNITFTFHIPAENLDAKQ